MKYKNFEATIFVICNASSKFTKYCLMKSWSHTVQKLVKQNESFIFISSQFSGMLWFKGKTIMPNVHRVYALV